eukprot:GHVN01069309.1.p1 GENE.GHVN01069309.1~~GHVN01069309.1.p1  ORF type:complete len:457 (-),score=45.41 GHVN01069309.1:1225-2595(-)
MSRQAHLRRRTPTGSRLLQHWDRWAAEFAAFTTVQGGQPRTGEQADADQHLWAKEFAVPSTQSAFPGTSGPLLRSLRPLNPSLYRTPANQHTAPTHESYEDTVQPPELGIEAAKRLEDVLKDVGKSNGKLRESEFTKFVSHLANGDIEVSGNNLTDSKGNPVDWDELYAAEHKGDDGSQNHETEVISSPDFERQLSVGLAHLALEKREEEVSADDVNRMARDLSDLSATLTAEGLFEKLWNENIAGTLDGKSRLFEESRSHANHPYTFEPNNPYLNIANPGLRGRELVREGKTSEAILALEAEVTADPECSEGWRMLGELHADNDQDVEAIECLKRGHQADPYNLESLMALGVSLANEFNQSDALGYLKTWLENHEDSCFGFKDFSTPLKHSLGDRKPQLMEMFRNACTSAPDYVNAHIAAGVVCNINQHTNAAFDHFSKAILNGKPVSGTSWGPR